MATIKAYTEITVDGKTITGNRLSPVTLTVTSLAYSIQGITLAVAPASQLMWTTANGGITTYTLGYLLSTQDIYIERRTDNATPEFSVELVKADVPFWFTGTVGGDTTESLDGVALVDGTDIDDVDRIEIQNASSTAATVSMFLFT